MKRFPPRRILVAADRSEPSLSALDAAQGLARRWDSALEIVYAAPAPELVAGPNAVLAFPSAAEPWRDVEKRLRAAAAGFPSARLAVRTVHGWPPAALADMARPDLADLFVIGTHGYGGLDRLVSGSVSEAVVRDALIPVLTIPARRAGARASRVLAPWNGRPYATRALRWAREWARDLGAVLDVIRVRESGRASEGEPAMKRRLSAVLGSGADWTLRIFEGDARARIAVEANSGRYALAVLSAHRRSSAADVVLGGTVERLLRRSRIPVLAVPSGRSAPLRTADLPVPA